MHNESTYNEHAALNTPAGLTHDLLAKHETTGNLFWIAVVLCGVLFVLGIVGFALRLQDGVNNSVVWGYHAAVFTFILTTAQAAPLVAIVTRMTKSHWRRPISRSAELFTVVGLFNILLFIPLLWVLPSLEDNRRSLWFYNDLQIPAHMPHIMATLALLLLIITGVMLLWVSSLPDLAAIRDGSTGRRQRLFARLAYGWHGTSRQWHTQRI